MFKPGLDKKCLHHSSFDGGVFEYSPGIRAVASTLMTELFQRGEEWLAIPWIDPIFHCDQHRSPILLDFMSDDWRRPVHRWCQVDLRTGLELPAPRQGNCHDDPRSGHEVCGGQAEHPGNLSPDRAAERNS